MWVGRRSQLELGGDIQAYYVVELYCIAFSTSRSIPAPPSGYRRSPLPAIRHAYSR